MHLLLTHIYCFITCRESQVELREHIDNLATGNTRYYIQSLWALHAGKLIVCVCVYIRCRVMQNKWTPEGGFGFGPLCKEAAERKTKSGASKQHIAECSGQCLSVY